MLFTIKLNLIAAVHGSSNIESNNKFCGWALSSWNLKLEKWF